MFYGNCFEPWSADASNSNSAVCAGSSFSPQFENNVGENQLVEQLITHTHHISE